MPRSASLFAATALVVGAFAAFPACGGNDYVSVRGDAGPAADAGLGPLEAKPPAIIPEDKRKDASSSPVVYDFERGDVWTANGDVGTVSFVDIDQGRVLQEIQVGRDIRSVALSPDAVWLAAVDREGAAVTLLDAETHEVRRTIPLGTHPRAAVWDAANPRFLYVSLEDDGAVAVVDRTLGVLAQNIPVGPIPAGLAVSRLRPELYATHRIDARVTIVNRDTRAVDGEVPLADQDADPDPKVPQGHPFAFESLALAPDGVEAWVPHELLAETHPFQFQSTVFPAVSVVDLSQLRTEVVTDPVSGTIQGRKVLFDAINVPDPKGNATIVSQPCAAAIHPNGVAAYALACGSEDLLVFDVLSGRAIDLVRNLPGDHPVGLALDTAGDRAFVLADQSHTLVRLDLAGGSLVKHPRLLGDPIPLVAKDPVDPEMRAGLTLFYRANSQKGELATTGNDWMACGSCHLDGFVGTNDAFFAMAKVVDPAIDARIGHAGLKDLFSTAPTPVGPAFSPHDVVVALREQGGLAPDRTGQDRTGEEDPNAPSPAAVTMARRLARVIARDLPLGPTWLIPGQAPDPNYDTAWCGNCHKEEYDAWKKSGHAHAGEDKMVRFCAGVENGLHGAQYGKLCAGCHDPVSLRGGDSSMTSGRGVTCLGCHDVTRAIRAGGNADLEAAAHNFDDDHKAWGQKSLELVKKPEFCGGCHEQFVPGTGIVAIDTYGEWSRGPFAQGPTPTTCVDCHMPEVKAGLVDHSAIGGNVYLATTFGDADTQDRVKTRLTGAVRIQASRSGNVVTVHLVNRAGHAFPTGVSDLREPWVELQAVDAQKKVIARYGGPAADGTIPHDAARLTLDIARADGTPLLLHELSDTVRLPYDVRIPAGESLDVFVAAPSTLPAGAVELDAVLLYRNLRATYYRPAVGDANALPPETEIDRVAVP